MQIEEELKKKNEENDAEMAAEMIAKMQELASNVFLKIQRGEFNNPTDEETEKTFKEDADQGDETACKFLGAFYEKKEDFEKALKYYLLAAEKEEMEAQFLLALCYEEGRGTEKNTDLAFQWMEKSANQTYAPAQYKLGMYYQEGIGTLSNSSIAFEWLQKAAKQGHAAGLFELAICYDQGKGVEENQVEASDYYLDAIIAIQMELDKLKHIASLNEKITKTKSKTDAQQPYSHSIELALTRVVKLAASNIYPKRNMDVLLTIIEKVSNTAAKTSPTAQLESLLQNASIETVSNGVRVVFKNPKDVQEFQQEILKWGFENRGMKGAPRKPDVLMADINHSQDRYAISFTLDEWEFLKPHAPQTKPSTPVNPSKQDSKTKVKKEATASAFSPMWKSSTAPETLPLLEPIKKKDKEEENKDDCCTKCLIS